MYWKSIFGKFQQKNLNLTQEKYLTEESLKEFKDKYDVCLDIKQPNDIMCNGKKIKTVGVCR